MDLSKICLDKKDDLTVTSRTYNILSFLVFRKNKLTYVNKKRERKKMGK